MLAAAAAVAAPDLPAAVVRHLKVALCIAGGDVCRDADARARGLEPCVSSATSRSRDVGVEVSILRSGHARDVVVEERSDGTVVVRGTDGGRIGAGIGVGALGVEVGAHGEVEFRRGREWTFPDRASARRFLDAVPDELRLTDDGDVHRTTGLRAPVRFIAGGTRVGSELGGAVGARRGEVSIPGAGGELRQLLGRRVGPDGTTRFYELGAEADGPLAELLGADGATTWIAEWREGTPDVLAVRSPGRLRDGRRTERVMTLPLADAGDRRAAARAVVWKVAGPLGEHAMRELTRRVRARGSVERHTYAETRSVSGVGLGGRLGPLGAAFDHEAVRVSRRLVAAEVLTGGRVRERADCLGAA